MTLQRGYTDEIKNLTAKAVIGAAKDELLESTLNKVDKHLDSPLRLYASATPDEYLNIAANVVEAGDGAAVSTPPVDSLIGAFAGGRIGFQAKTAPAGVKVAGSTFTFPTGTTGQYRRLAFGYLSTGEVSAAR